MKTGARHAITKVCQQMGHAKEDGTQSQLPKGHGETEEEGNTHHEHAGDGHAQFLIAHQF